LSVAGGLTQVKYLTVDAFDSITLELRSVLAYRTERAQAEASVGYLSDRASSTRPGGDRVGWHASLQGRTRLAHEVFAELGWTRQTWLNESAYSPGLIDQIRYQNTQVLRGALIFPVAERQAIHVEVRQVRNAENISIFQYNSHQLQVSWQWKNW
jgi:hypothetical protein